MPKEKKPAEPTYPAPRIFVIADLYPCAGCMYKQLVPIEDLASQPKPLKKKKDKA